MAGNKIGITATLDDQVSSRLDRVRDKFNQMGKGAAAASLLGNVGAMALNKGFSLVGDAVSHVIGFLGDSAHAYIEDERSIQQLNTSLKANVAGWNGSTDAIERTIKTRRELGFTDEEQRQSLAGLVAATHDVSKALSVEGVAMDLARFKHIDLAEASQALTKVEAGSYRVLKSLGIQLKEGATQTEALAAVEKVAGGQAAGFADTIEGRLVVAQVKAHEAEVKLGDGLAHLEAFVLPAVADAVVGLADRIDKLAFNMGHLGDVIPKEQLGDTVGPFFTLGSGADALTEKLGLTSGEMANLGDFAGKMADDFDGVTHSASNLSLSIQLGSGHVQAMGATFRIATAEASDLEGAIAGLSSTIEHELFGKAINAGNEAQFKDNIKDLKDQRDAVHKGSLKWLELTGQIAENRQALFDLHLEEAAQDGPQAAIDFLKKERDHAGAAKDEIDKLITKYERLAALQGTLGPIIVTSDGGPKSRAHKHGVKPHAAGGHMAAGEVGLVGEEGAELWVPDSPGTVVPARATAASGSGHGHDIYLDGYLVGRAIDSRMSVSMRLAPGSIGPNV